MPALHVHAGMAERGLELAYQLRRRVQAGIAHQRGDARNLHPFLAQGGYKLPRRCAGGQNILNHHHLLARKLLQRLRVFQDIASGGKGTVAGGNMLHFACIADGEYAPGINMRAAQIARQFLPFACHRQNKQREEEISGYGTF